LKENAKGVSLFMTLAALIAAAIVPAIDKLRNTAAKAVIEAPATADRGPVIVRGTKSTGQSFEWSSNAPFVAIEGGKSAALNVTSSGAYQVALRVRSSAGGKFTEDVATATILVGNAPPGPAPPGPTPPGPLPPGPTPPGPSPLPDGRFKLAAATLKAVSENVKRSTRAQEARTLAAALRDVVKQISDGKLSGKVPIASAMVGAYTKGLGAARAEWDSAIQQVRKAMFEALNAGSAEADFATAIAEVATGLEAVQ
jgi:hypothetical protein